MIDFRALFGFAAPYRVVLALGAMMMLLESVAALTVPWFGGRLADTLLSGNSGVNRGIGLVLWAMLALFALQALLRFGSASVLGAAAQRIVADLKIRLYDHLQALPLAFFQQRRMGDTLALLTHDVYVVSGYLSGTALAIVPLLFTGAGAVVLMMQIQAPLALATAFLIPVFYLMVKVIGRKLRPLAQELQQEHATGVAIAEENLGMLPAIKAFTREGRESHRHGQQMDLIRQLETRQLRIQAAMSPAVQFVAAAGIVLLLWLGSGEVAGGKLTPAELIEFLLYSQLLVRPVAGLADLYGQTQSTRGAMRRLMQALDEEPEPAPNVGAVLPKGRGEIRFEGVTFGYPGRPAALQDLHFHVAAGETVAITGPNGAGKSTLAHLLTRLHETRVGRIMIDGTDIATVSLASLRSQVGTVPQHVLLFNATVRENIAYGRLDSNDAQVEAAARAAQAHDFIVGLPLGYDTAIGDQGVRLSGGQRQRIALARALLKDPPILILDEATAMFDPEAEKDFLQGCREVLKGRTVLLITHRPASLVFADRVVSLENGRLDA
ncbi:MAG: ABC transporter ATP-binding protein [Betaproteobacteria bacterium]|nr:ABC transporter ATP-binding protein [Betaproteobacteria bacterium]